MFLKQYTAKSRVPMLYMGRKTQRMKLTNTKLSLLYPLSFKMQKSASR